MSYAVSSMSADATRRYSAYARSKTQVLPIPSPYFKVFLKECYWNSMDGWGSHRWGSLEFDYRSFATCTWFAFVKWQSYVVIMTGISR